MSLSIAVTHATAWPELRRGSERLLHDLAAHYAGAGMRASIVTATPGAPGADPPGVERIVLRRRHLRLGRWLTPFHGFALDLARLLGERRFDVLHCLGYLEAAAAGLARRHAPGMRLLYQCTGIPLRRAFRRVPLDGLLFRTAVARADAVLVLSRFAASQLAAEYGRSGVLMPAPVATSPFRAVAKLPLQGDPVLLFTGDAAEPRKGAALLVRALGLLRQRHPGASVVFAGPAPAAVQDALRALAPAPEALRFVDATAADLPALYAGATVTVNPAVWEAFGMVLVESLAAGTPVVGCDHAGTPDIVGDPAIGRLFAPGPIRGHAATDAEALAEAIDATIGLARDPATAPRCRAHAGRFAWSTLGPSYTALATAQGRA